MVFPDQDKETYTINQNRPDQVHPSEASCVKTVEKSNNADIGQHLKSSFEVNSPKIVKKNFSNGDANLKSWRGRLPDGKGKYLWPDGCTYEINLDRGKNAENGKVFWTSGATYEGEFSGSNIHGSGTYTRVDGTIYRGSWNMNVKHGVGWKKYANGDIYQGSWRQGVQDGEGRYNWADGTVYMGEWKMGAMCGKGTITWDNGDSYSGQWLDGLQHGHGVYTWSDGGRYAGTWSKGIKHGKGTFYPAGTEVPEGSTALCNNPAGNYLNDVILRCRNYKFSCTPSYNGSACVLPWRSCASFRKLPSGMFSKSSQSVCVNRMLERPWSLEGFAAEIAELGTGSASMKVDLKSPLWKDHFEIIEAKPPIVEREYVQGVLISESLKKEFLSSLKGTRHKHRRQVKRPGETIVKGHRSYDLMLSLQVGIRYTISRATPKPKHELKHSDFAFGANVRVRFPREGSTFTPPHTSVDFKWKDYRPMVFRYLRETFQIDAADYMMSICGNDALRELSSPGKSGSIFFLSNDDRFMIKTLRKSEVKVLLWMLPNYYNHVLQHKNTLITKFCGLHLVKPSGGRKVRFVVMGNILCTELRIHRRYDLKGSLQGRSADKIEIDETATLKDLDLNFVFHLDPSWCEAVIRQIELDCSFLESQRIMDYSLLLGLHFRAPEYPKLTADSQFPECVEMVDNEEWSHSSGLVLVTFDHKQGSNSQQVRDGSLKATTRERKVDRVLSKSVRLQVQLGKNMPAKAESITQVSNQDIISNNSSSKIYDVILYFGIIDILQKYDISKRMEHYYKSLHFDPASISAVNPHLYSQRFQQFLKKTFPPGPNLFASI